MSVGEGHHRLLVTVSHAIYQRTPHERLVKAFLFLLFHVYGHERYASGFGRLPVLLKDYKLISLSP
jgi:hypothetical protein